MVHAATKRRLKYGSLAEAAAKLPVPQDVPLKTPSQYRIIGKPTKRLDTPAKVNGSAQYGIDVRIPGMLYAVIARCPVFGGKVASFDAAKAKLDSRRERCDPDFKRRCSDRGQYLGGHAGPPCAGSAVGRRAERKAHQRRHQQSRLLMPPRCPARLREKKATWKPGWHPLHRNLTVDYEVPFLAHATMEPQNCTAHVRADRCDVWAPTQAQTSSQATAARITGLDISAVFIHTTFLGGGFGRRFEADFIGEAVEVSKATGAPVKVTWSREDDMQHDYYRMVSHARCTAGLDADGWPVVWSSRVSSPSLLARFGPLKDNFDHRSVESLDDVPYTIPNILIDFQLVNTGVPDRILEIGGRIAKRFFSGEFC